MHFDDFSNAKDAYAQSTRSIGDARGLEYQVFARITRQLSAANDRADEDFPAYAAALHENLRLWTLLASDVARDGNKLPAALRAQIFYLFEFTRAHTRKALDRAASVHALIDINTAIMRGLKSPPAKTEAA